MKLSGIILQAGWVAVMLMSASLTLTARAAEPGVAAPIRALDQALIGAMKAGKSTPFGQRYAALAPVIERTFDLPAILKASVGLRWASLSPAEQQRLLEAFRKFTVASYTANFNQFGGERIDVSPESRTIGADQVVGTKIVSGSEATPIDYVMRRTPEGWRAIDVLLNGSISQVAVNRSDWRALLASGAAPLIESLQRRVATLSGGAIN